MTPAVTCAGLTVRYPRRPGAGLAGVDLDLEPGERVLVAGPSGGGKSTLLHALTGVVPQSVDATVGGRLRVLGQDPARVPVARLALDVGWLGQDPASGTCLPYVDAEVAFPLENRGVARAEIGPRVARALADVGAAHLVGRRTSTLSGGEQQRVALAAVLVGEPRLLVLDEPTSMLDPVAAAAVLDLLGRVTGREVDGSGPARTTVLVEHRLAEMSWTPERTVVIAGGRVASDAPTGDGTTRHVAQGAGGVAGRRPWAPTRRSTVGDVVRRVRGAAYGYGVVPAVSGVDLELREGQVTAVVGTNGCGKSTLLLGLAGLLPALAGLPGPQGRGGRRPRRGGRAPSGTALPGPGEVGLVFQRPEHQLLARTVAGEVAYGLVRARGLRRPDARVAAAVEDALARVGLRALADADPFRLSGGEQRRLSVVAMGVLERPVLLLDEPTFGLDPEQTGAVLALVAELAAGGTAVVLATHDLRLARCLADQVLVLGRGASIACGGPELLDDRALLGAAGLLVPADGPPPHEPVAAVRGGAW